MDSHHRETAAGRQPWYQRYFDADYWVYATAEYTAERTAAEVAYLAEVFRPAPGRRVLDLGCGIGRHAVGLAARGFDVTGVDVSGYALDRARKAADDAGVRVELHQLDVLGRWPDLGRFGKFDAVACVQAFGWGSDADQLRLLRRLRRLLVPGGVLLLDHSNVSAVLRIYAEESVAEVDGHTFRFLRRYDQVTGRSGGVVRVRRPDGSTAELPDDVRLYQPPEVAGLLTTAGFDVLRVDAEFTAGAPVGMDSRYVQFVAVAPPPVASSPLAGYRRTPVAGELDLRWAADEATLVEDALVTAWRTVAGDGAPASGPLPARARRYDVLDPYGAERAAPVLAEHFGVSLAPERVTAGAGATGLLHGLAGLSSGGSVLVEPDGHPQLAMSAGELGAAVRQAEPAELLAAIRRLRPAVTVLDRPGIGGRVAGADQVGALADAASASGGVLVVDETCAAYLEPAASLIGLTGQVGGLVVVRSMSKGYCCGGLRVGFAVASADVAERVRAVCQPLAVGALAVDVALALLAHGDVLAAVRARIAEVKPRFVAWLRAARFEVAAGDPRVPWVLLPGDGGTVDRLQDHGVLGKQIEGPMLRLSVPLSADRVSAAAAALTGDR